MSGDVTEAQLHYIIRDHDRDRFEARKALFHRCADAINAQYGLAPPPPSPPTATII